MFADNTVYIVGNAKTQQNNPITHHYTQLFIGFVVEKDTGKIVTCASSVILPLTGEFITSLFSGRSMREDFEVIKQQIESRYFGSSQKAIVVAFKDAQKKFFRIISGQPFDVND
ncbi:hypothetical protein SATMO3_49060 [Sporomusa aerivorans]